jgi:hypothetical protein
MMAQKIKFPYGISNLLQIITQGYILIDKTYLLALLEDEKLVSFLRPRRIGKSCFVSLLEYYYDIHTKHLFETLFANLYVGKNPTPLANSFRILKFDFSGVDTCADAKATEKSFVEKVRDAISAFIEKYELFDKETKSGILNRDNAGSMIHALFSAYTEEEIKIYLIIDEYDHFTNEILSRSLDEFLNTVSLDGYVRKFYENIKIACQNNVVDRFFITGVSPITLDSLTSGFNIVTHLTHDLRFHNMMGFTEEEVGQLLEMVLEDKTHQETIMEDLKQWYNGYKFHRKSPQTIYNANMVLFFLQHFKESQEYPSLMLDPNIMPDYGKLKKMFEVANYQGNLEVLQTVLEKGEIQCEQIYQFDFVRPFGKVYFINFLFYLGNLTIKSESEYGYGVMFQIPNHVIKELYWQYYAYLVQERLHFEYEDDRVKESIYQSMGGEVMPFLKLIEKAMKELSNRDFQGFDEKYVKMLVIAYAMQGGAFYVLSERETKGGGYVDVELYKRPNNLKRHCEYVFEIKYIKKEEEKTFETVKTKAIAQLKNYLQTDEIIQNKEWLKAMVLIFVKDVLYVEEVK